VSNLLLVKQEISPVSVTSDISVVPTIADMPDASYVQPKGHAAVIDRHLLGCALDDKAVSSVVSSSVLLTLVCVGSCLRFVRLGWIKRINGKVRQCRLSGIYVRICFLFWVI
jgi:hypothetical protein